MVLAKSRVGKMTRVGKEGATDARGLRTWTRFLGRYDPVGWLGGRESIFKISHTGEFRGIGKVATQTVRSHLRQTGGRRVYKKERRRKQERASG